MLGRLVKDLLGRVQPARDDHPSTDVGLPTSTPDKGADKRVIDVSTADQGKPDFWARDHSPLSDLTIVVPFLPIRIHFLKTLLAHFSASRIVCPVIITVNSDAAREAEVDRIVATHPELSVRVFCHPMTVHFVDRLNECARYANTKYVFVHSDDDFVVAGALADCVDFLNAHDDYVACEGRSFFFSVKGTELVPQPQRFLTRDENHCVTRVLEHCRKYTNTFHAVTRKEAFLTANEQTIAHTQQVIYWQYLASCWLLALGKLKVIDRLYYMRLDTPGGERAMLMKRADRRHWPYLIVAPDFSAEQELFKAGLIAAMRGHASSEQLAFVADECCLGLIRRAFGAPLQYDRSEIAMHSRFFDPMSHEAEVARYCGPRSIDCMAALAAAKKPLASAEAR